VEPERRARLTRLLDDEGLDALVLRRPPNVAWAGGGARTHIDVTAEAGVAWLVVTRDGVRVVTSQIEADRLAAEELRDDRLEWTVLDWDADPADAVPSGDRVGVDGTLPGRRDVSGLIEAARRVLLPSEQDRYRALGRDAAAALTATAVACGPTETEHAWASRAAAELIAHGADPVVLLVAGEERVRRFRHPLPTATPAGRLVMVVVCARRHGLIANVTRFVSVGPLPGDLRDAQERLLGVEAAFLDATRPGTPVGEVFTAGTAAYGAQGFADDEWRRHHQGGPTGFLSRDHIATPACTEPVEAGQAFAWNPSVPGLKVEDTVLATGDGVEVLSVDPEWPTVEVAGRRRPVVLERD
jgi:Xaa-Pro aminopeptidase